MSPSPSSNSLESASNRRYSFIRSRLSSSASIHSTAPLLSAPPLTPKTMVVPAVPLSDEDYRLFEAIDRQSTLSFSNQRGAFSAASLRKLEVEALSRSMNRLNRGEMADQQADQEDTLFSLHERLLKANNRTLEQRVSISMDNRAGREIEQAKVDATLERMEKLRFHDQDWKSPSEVKEEELTLLIQLLTQTPEEWSRQRVQLDPKKELDMFISGIVGRSTRSRLVNQDASPAAIVLPL